MKRHLAWGMVLLCLTGQSAGAADPEPRGTQASGELSTLASTARAFTRVRSVEPYVALKRVIWTIEASDLPVYVCRSVRRPSTVSGSLQVMARRAPLGWLALCTGRVTF